MNALHAVLTRKDYSYPDTRQVGVTVIYLTLGFVT
jgi:hypothetical protein